MIDKEKVRELAKFIAKEQSKKALVYWSDIENNIDEWLEQNKPEPVVVGLSDEQVSEIVEILYNKTDVSNPHEPEFYIKEWLKTQTFVQPSPIGVGLSDEQVESLTDYIGCSADTITKVRHKIVGWLKTQTFVQSVEFSSEELADSYQSLYEDFGKVKKELEQLKSQQFTPNWDDAPECANWVAQDEDGSWHWHDNKPIQSKALFGNFGIWQVNEGDCIKFASANKNWQQTLRPRPKPTPSVEVGQIWKCKDYCYTVISAEIMKYDNEWLDTVGYKADSGICYIRTLSDFIAKFEQVKS